MTTFISVKSSLAAYCMNASESVGWFLFILLFGSYLVLNLALLFISLSAKQIFSKAARCPVE